MRAGDRIIYAFTVTNTGNVTMNNVGVNDPTGSAVTCPKPTLAPGQSEICLSRDRHTVTAAEVANATYLVDSATPHGTPTVGTQVESLRVTVMTPVRKLTPPLLLHRRHAPSPALTSGRC